ncbi:MAG: response regulator transcription factor [Solirubrobacterales bacterium]|nr:response regulator transcription factor [Solirubrobacterales bacterium]
MATYARSRSHLQRLAGPAAPANGRAVAAGRPGAVEELRGGREVESSGFGVAILDSDSGFLVVLAKRLERLGWKHRVLPAKVSAKTLASIEADVLIVDLALLGAQRWKWLARICEQRPDVRVIVCSGTSTAAERVCALRLGADDWLSKPCHPEELIARVEVVTAQRRRPEPQALEPVAIGEVEIRPDQFQAFVRGCSLRLTRREYQLIELLSRADGEVLAREHIYERLWSSQMIRNDRSVDVFVHKLRRKLEHASPRWRYVHTHFGIGYRFAGELVDGGAPVHDLRIAEDPAAEPIAA